MNKGLMKTYSFTFPDHETSAEIDAMRAKSMSSYRAFMKKKKRHSYPGRSLLTVVSTNLNHVLLFLRQKDFGDVTRTQ